MSARAFAIMDRHQWIPLVGIFICLLLEGALK